MKDVCPIWFSAEGPHLLEDAMMSIVSFGARLTYYSTLVSITVAPVLNIRPAPTIL